MARVAGKLLLLQIIGFLYCSATAQYEDLEDFSGGFSGDARFPDNEFGDDEDFDYEIDYIPDGVDICHTYPSGIIINEIRCMHNQQMGGAIKLLHTYTSMHALQWVRRGWGLV